MAKKFDEKVVPVVNQLRQAISAIDRARRDNYPPHVAACMAAAKDHINRAAALAARAA